MVSTEGKAMTAAEAGMLLQVRIQGGQLISGTLQADGIVERSN
jgi:flagella basal body P-ring formation protein FlgA